MRGKENKPFLHGVVNVYKERGYTSHDVVAILRKWTGQKKIGHTGTLDPDAEGVLPVCFGKATKVCEFLTGQEKTYETVLLLGRETDTQDVTGETIATGETAGLTETQIRETVRTFVGDIRQIPPMYSACKINGKKLYELARAGQTVERKPRPVTIHSIEILSVEIPRVRMRVVCSKGTYIRTLCHDIGEALGCHGCMEALKRTRTGIFAAEDSVTLSQIQKRLQNGTFSEILKPVDELFSEDPRARVSADWEKQARNGGELPREAVRETEARGDREIRLYDEAGRFIALYRWDEETNMYRIRKMFFPEP